MYPRAMGLERLREDKSVPTRDGFGEVEGGEVGRQGEVVGVDLLHLPHQLLLV